MLGSHILRLMAASPLLVLAACGDDDDPAGLATNFSATLSGANEVPTNASTATGNATLSVSGNQITYTVNVTNLANAVVAHIHVGAAGVNGPVRLNLCGTGDPQPPCVSGTGVLATGTNGTTVGITFEELLSAMRSGEAYVNVHTDNGQPPPNTGPGDLAAGEIRGQIVSD